MSKTMEDYIREIPDVLLANIENRKELTAVLAKYLAAQGVRGVKNDEAKADAAGSELVIVASGSSRHAALCAKSFMDRHVKRPVRIVTPFTFQYYETIREESSYLFVSQSGSSTNTIAAVQAYEKSTGKSARVIVGSKESTLSKMCPNAVAYGVGEETVGYVTKGMSTLTLFFMLLALALDTSADEEAELSALRTVAKAHGNVYSFAKDFCLAHEEELLKMKHAQFIGCGANEGTIAEGALKLSEMVHIPTSSYEVEEFIHGPDLQMSPEYNLFFVDGGDAAGERVREIAQAAALVTKQAYLLSARDFLNEEKIEETLTPLYLTAFFQYLACFAAGRHGAITEHPLYERFEEKIHCKTEDYTETDPF